MSSQNNALQPPSLLATPASAGEVLPSQVPVAAPAVEGPKAIFAGTTVANSGATASVRALWQARGLFGGLLAILLAWLGQRALIEQNDSQTSTRFYIIAIFILIASLFHPSWPWRRTASSKIEGAADLTLTDADVPVNLPNGSAPTLTPATQEVTGTTLPARPVRSQAVRAAQKAAVEVPATRQFSAWVPGQSTPMAPIAAGSSQTAQPSAVAVPAVIARPARTQEAPADQGLLSRLHRARLKIGWKGTVAGVGAALLLAVASVVVLQNSITSPLGGWLWVAALVILLVSLVGLRGGSKGKALLPGPLSDFFGRGVPQMNERWAVALLLVVLVVASVLRLYNLEYMPGIFGDEGERGMDARSVLAGDNRLIFAWGWWGVPNLYFYIVSFFLRFLGDHNMVADRMLSVVSGVVAVFFVYRIGKLLWGARVGLIAAALLAVSPLALQFSRLAGESTPTGTLWAVGFFYMVMALRHRRWSDWTLAGLAWGFSLYFYAAGKLIIPLVAVLAAYCLVRWRLQFFKQYALGFAVLFVVMGFTFMPYGLYNLKNDWAGLLGRAQETSIFSPQNQAGTFARYNLPYDPGLASGSMAQSVLNHPLPWAQVIYQQLRETTDVLYRRPDQVVFYRIDEHGGSMFPPLWAAIVMLGLAYTAWKAWDGRFGLVGLWFLFGLLGSVLTVDAPNLQRITGAWPALMLLPAAMLDRVFAASWPLNLKLARTWSVVPIGAALVFFGFTSYNEYFSHYYSLCPYCDATTQARYVLALGQDYKAYQGGVGGYDVYFGYGSTRFLAKDVEGEDLLNAADTLPIVDNNGKGAAFIIYPNNQIYLPLIEQMYPGGAEEVIKSYDGTPHFTSYKLTREQLAALQTLHATYVPNSSQSVTRDEPNLGTEALLSTGSGAAGSTVASSASSATASKWVAPQGLAYPAQATWQGGLVAPSYGTYTFAFDGPAGDAQLEIDGHVVLGNGAPAGGNGQLVMAKGLHDVKLTGTLANASTNIGVVWSGGGAQATAIESRFLYNGPTGGLSGEVGPLTGTPQEALKAADPLAGQGQITRRSDSFVGFRVAPVLFGDGAFVGRWQGKLDAPADGDYVFTLSIPGLPQPTSAAVLIDGQSVASPDNGETGTIHLTKGQHAVDVRYARQPGGDGRIEWLWTPPGGQQALVPPTVLTPLTRSWLPGELPNAPQAQVPQAPPPSAPTPQANVVQPQRVIGTDAGLAQPRGIAVDGQGNAYIGDNNNHRIVVLSPEGKVIHSWGKAAPMPAPANSPTSGATPGPGEFDEINDVAVGPDGAVYVLDSSLRLQAFTASGDFIGEYPAAWLGLYGANGIAVGPSSSVIEPPGNTGGASGGQSTDYSIYIAATGQNRIEEVPSITSMKGKIEGAKAGENPILGEERSIEGPAGDKLEQPVDVVVDPSSPNTLYTIDLKDRIVQLKLSTPATPAADPNVGSWTISKSWSVPVGRNSGGSRLAISASGNKIYMSDPDRARVAVLDIASGNVSYFGTLGSDPGDFKMPSGIGIRPDNSVYVLDRDAANVQVFNPQP